MSVEIPFPFQIELSSQPHSDERAVFVRSQLNGYNFARVGEDEYTPLNVYLLDDEGQPVGGLLGGTYWKWLSIDILWVSDDLRSKGYGGRLLAAAEQEAVRRGCRHAHVDTLDFQAPHFYLQRGYVEWGRLVDLPPGHSRIFIRKELAGNLLDFTIPE